LIYKVVEANTVTDEMLERIINEWVSRGWHFDSIQFVIRDASKRPSMAFLFFVREVREAEHALTDEGGEG
jgi:hypothetical protein